MNELIIILVKSNGQTAFSGQNPCHAKEASLSETPRGVETFFFIYLIKHSIQQPSLCVIL